MKRFLLAAVIVLTIAASMLMAVDFRRTSFGVVVPSGTTPSPDGVEGALFLDTNLGTHGTLLCYANGAWRTVMELP